MGVITFIDALGAATLSNGRTEAYARRFANWTPDAEPIGPIGTPLTRGPVSRWVHATEYRVTLTIADIPEHPVSAGTVFLLTVAQRLKIHLLNGGLCTLATEDLDNRSYPGVWLAHGTQPTLQLTDRTARRYAFTVTLMRTDAPFVCRYGGLVLP
jgi:hypothetical protein